MGFWRRLTTGAKSVSTPLQWQPNPVLTDFGMCRNVACPCRPTRIRPWGQDTGFQNSTQRSPTLVDLAPHSIIKLISLLVKVLIIGPATLDLSGGGGFRIGPRRVRGESDRFTSPTSAHMTKSETNMTMCSRRLNLAFQTRAEFHRFEQRPWATPSSPVICGPGHL